MYKQNKRTKSSIEINTSVEGETLETKIERITTNKEPITDGAPKIYTERKLGVLPAYNIRTDRFEIAIEAMDKLHKVDIARRDERYAERQKALEELNKKDENKTGTDGKPESIGGTNE